MYIAGRICHRNVWRECQGLNALYLFSLKVRVRKRDFSSCGHDFASGSGTLPAHVCTCSLPIPQLPKSERKHEETYSMKRQHFVEFSAFQTIARPTWAATRKQLSNNGRIAFRRPNLPAKIAGYAARRLTPVLPSGHPNLSNIRAEKDVGLHSCNLRHKAPIEVGLNSMFN